MNNKIYRIIDANLNRAREGLRVCEDIARLALENKHLSRTLKSARQGVVECEQTLNKAGRKALIKARDAQRDLGRHIKFDTSRKKDLKDLFQANMRRAQESLRVLEEFSVLVNKKATRGFKALRFKTYSVEKKADEILETVRRIRHRNSRR